MRIAIGIPTINRSDLLKENLEDLSKNFSDLDSLIIVDNGKQAFKIPDNLKDKVSIHVPKSNLGVGGSWNYMLDTSFNNNNIDNVFLLNDDIVFGKDRQYLESIIEEHPGYYVTTGSYFWSMVLISKEGYKTIGKFDEKFFPAYFEDNDYYYRIKLSGEVEKKFINLKNKFVPEIRRNSMTIQKDHSLNNNFNKNKSYYVEKWGGLPLHEKYLKPFNR